MNQLLVVLITFILTSVSNRANLTPIFSLSQVKKHIYFCQPDVISPLPKKSEFVFCKGKEYWHQGLALPVTRLLA